LVISATELIALSAIGGTELEGISSAKAPDPRVSRAAAIAFNLWNLMVCLLIVIESTD